MPDDYMWEIDPKLGLNIRDHEEYIDWINDIKSKVLKTAIKNQRKYDKKRKRKYDKNAKPRPLYKVGDRVLHYIHDKDKMSPKWSKPHTIMRFLENDNVVVLRNNRTGKERSHNLDNIKLATYIHMPDLESVDKEPRDYTKNKNKDHHNKEITDEDDDLQMSNNNDNNDINRYRSPIKKYKLSHNKVRHRYKDKSLVLPSLFHVTKEALNRERPRKRKRIGEIRD